MNSRVNLAELSDVFSLIPRPLLNESTRFRQGEVLVGGNIIATPLFARLFGRISQEGGADVPTDWAS